MQCGDADGNRVLVFDHPWWRVDRWLVFLWLTRVRKMSHGRLTLHFSNEGSTRPARCVVLARPPKKYP